MSQEPQSQELPNVILTKNNVPFKTEQVANMQLNNKKLKDTHEVKPYADGYALQRKTEAPAAPATDTPPPPATTPEPTPAATTPAPAAAPAPAAVPPSVANPIASEPFYRVRFQTRSDKNQPENVELSVNGDTLLIKREIEVIIPARYKEAADHALTAQYDQIPGQQRKCVGYIKLYPYDLLGEASYEEYLQMKNEGNDMMQKLYGAPVRV